MCVVATDAPLLSSQLERLARRAFLGLARVGSFASNGSGEVAIAFSTANREAFARDRVEDVRQVAMLANDALSPLFAGVVEATEEAVLNSLVRRAGAPGGDGPTVARVSRRGGCRSVSVELSARSLALPGVGTLGTLPRFNRRWNS